MHQTRGRCGQSIILTLRVSVLHRGAQAWSAYRCAAGFLSGLSRLWVISGGDGREDVASHVRFAPESGHALTPAAKIETRQTAELGDNLARRTRPPGVAGPVCRARKRIGSAKAAAAQDRRPALVE